MTKTQPTTPHSRTNEHTSLFWLYKNTLSIFPLIILWSNDKTALPKRRTENYQLLSHVFGLGWLRFVLIMDATRKGNEEVEKKKNFSSNWNMSKRNNGVHKTLFYFFPFHNICCFPYFYVFYLPMELFSESLIFHAEMNFPPSLSPNVLTREPIFLLLNSIIKFNLI